MGTVPRRFCRRRPFGGEVFVVMSFRCSPGSTTDTPQAEAQGRVPGEFQKRALKARRCPSRTTRRRRVPESVVYERFAGRYDNHAGRSMVESTEDGIPGGEGPVPIMLGQATAKEMRT